MIKRDRVLLRNQLRPRSGILSSSMHKSLFLGREINGNYIRKLHQAGKSRQESAVILISGRR